ncbi:uncharacterized protein B0P05DRAFT_562898 [Gilbertella persicaria]|uniref:uncharacterized protein n=1 Tax=Gilbertella persicaria TaxID=101096 RepID=UPI00222098C9|nr:uncharacterized protein B0P05DRAFT_562898 [Gilbertella persicaria]KAI8051084.1 hypothetical protein B0P05DRAFT_562898 [Gilbertella persicaria]
MSTTDTQRPNITAVIVDSQTGAAFRRRMNMQTQEIPSSSLNERIRNTHHPLRRPFRPISLGHAFDIDDSTSLSSHTYTESSMNSTSIVHAMAPPDHVPFSDYYKYLPNDLNPAQQKKQLFIWVAQKHIKQSESEPTINLDRDSLEAHHLANQVMKEAIGMMLDKDVHIPDYKRPDNSNYSQETPNPTNTENERKLAKLESTLQLFKDEMNEWKENTNQLYEEHAALVDQQEPLEHEIHLADFDYDELELDDPVQKEFVAKYLQQTHTTTLNYDLLNQINQELDLGVSSMRQTINSVYQFLQETDDSVSHIMARLAKEQRERSRYIPIMQDKRVPGILENTEEKRRESENKAVADILRLIARHGK